MLAWLLLISLKEQAFKKKMNGCSRVKSRSLIPHFSKVPAVPLHVGRLLSLRAFKLGVQNFTWVCDGIGAKKFSIFILLL